MPSIECEYYNTPGDYKLRSPEVSKKSTITFTKSQVAWAAVAMGKIGRYKPSKKEVVFNKALIGMSLDMSGGTMRMSDEYKSSESSIKGAISFFLGMTFTRIVARKKYNIRHLMHLRDPRLKVESTSGLHPDYFGITKSNAPMLFEAKGITSRYLADDSIDHAKDQLGAVKKVTWNGHEFDKKDIKRHAIVLSFSGVDAQLADVDPNPGKFSETDLAINSDIAILLYYADLYEMILNGKEYIEKYGEASNEKEYHCIKLEGLAIGIVDSVWKELKKKDSYVKKIAKGEDLPKDKNNPIEGAYTIIDKLLDKIPAEKDEENVFAGDDGILVKIL